MTAILKHQPAFIIQASVFFTHFDFRAALTALQNKKIHVKQYKHNLGPIPAIHNSDTWLRWVVVSYLGLQHNHNKAITIIKIYAASWPLFYWALPSTNYISDS